MNEDRIEGSAHTIGGKVQEAAGRLTGDAKTRVEGEVMRQRDARRISMARRTTPRLTRSESSRTVPKRSKRLFATSLKADLTQRRRSP